MTNFFLRLLKTYYCVLLLASHGEISAQRIDTTAYHQLDSVTVVAQKRVSTTRQTAPMQVLDKAGLEKLGIEEMADAIRRFSGVAVKDYGGIGGLKTVSIRSLGAQHTAVTYDGVNMSNAQNGQIDIGKFSLDNIEELSLTIGQNDNIFQSARSFASAGAINISKANPKFDSKSFNIHTKIKAGSFGLINPYIRYEQRVSDTWSADIALDYMTANGEYPFTLLNGEITTVERRANSDVEHFRTEMNLYGNFKEKGHLKIKGYFFDSERGLPGSVIFYNNEANERLWDKNGFVQLNYRTAFTNKWDFMANAKYNYAWTRYIDTNSKYPDGKQENIYTQNEYYASATSGYKPIENLSFSISQDAYVNTLVASFQDAANPIRLSSLTAFAAKYQNSRLTATGSLLNTYITESIENGEPSDSRKRLSPSIGTSYRILPNENIRLRFSYKDIFRVPTFNDLYYERIGNNDLESEKAKQLNLGATWGGAIASAGMEQINISIDAYYNKIEDKIVAIPTLFIWSMMNMGEVNITGIDANFSSKHILPMSMALEISANYTYQKAIDVTNPEAKNYEHQLPYTPLHSGTVSASLENKWVNLGYMLTAVGERYVLPQNTSANRVDGYREHTLTANRTFRINTSKIRIQANIINLLDSNYDVIKYYPMPGRSFQITATYIY